MSEKLQDRLHGQRTVDVTVALRDLIEAALEVTAKNDEGGWALIVDDWDLSPLEKLEDAVDAAKDVLEDAVVLFRKAADAIDERDRLRKALRELVEAARKARALLPETGSEEASTLEMEIEAAGFLDDGIAAAKGLLDE